MRPSTMVEGHSIHQIGGQTPGSHTHLRTNEAIESSSQQRHSRLPPPETSQRLTGHYINTSVFYQGFN